MAEKTLRLLEACVGSVAIENVIFKAVSFEMVFLVGESPGVDVERNLIWRPNFRIASTPSLPMCCNNNIGQ